LRPRTATTALSPLSLHDALPICLCMEFLRQTFHHSLMAKMGYLLAKPALSKLRQRLDPRRYNGAVFLGLNGVTVKSHGASDAYRSEEHTSELQSRENLVCRLLLE